MLLKCANIFCIVLITLVALLGCQRTDILRSGTDTEASFEADIQPILTANCALAGCHVADGPHGLDFRTYASFMAGGEHGPVFIPGNAEESEIVEEIVEGKMPPPPREPLSAVELQTLINWINQQEPHDDTESHAEAHDENADAHEDMNVEHHAVSP